MSEDILKTESDITEEMLKIKLLTPQIAEFYETEGGFVGVRINGEDKGNVSIIRTFPLTDCNAFLSVRLMDSKQEEVGIIEKLSDFDEKTVAIIDKQLKLRYFMPKITKVLSVKEEYGYTYWTVETDKGNAKFASSAGSSGAIIPHGNGVIIKDSNENRYLIEDLSKLTPKEMKKLDLYL